MAERFTRTARMIRVLALAVSLAVPTGSASAADPAEEPPLPLPAEADAAEELPLPLPAEPDAGKPAPPAGKILDTTHASLERNILEWVVWFDDFFGNVRTEDTRQPKYLLRWRNSVRWHEKDGFAFRTSARTSIRLPKISERLQLVISGENEPETGPQLPEDPGNPGFDRTLLQDTRLVNTELRYDVLRKPDTILFLGAGVRVRLPPEYFTRIRFQHTHRLSEKSLARFGETLFWKDQEGFGETTEIDLERKLAERTLVRLANSGTVSESRNGLEWGSELVLQHAFSVRNAAALGGGIFGRTSPSAVVETYRVFVRFRRNFFRSWLFYEVEPEVTWPRSDTGSYTSEYASTVRIEVLFQGLRFEPETGISRFARRARGDQPLFLK